MLFSPHELDFPPSIVRPKAYCSSRHSSRRVVPLMIRACLKRAAIALVWVLGYRVLLVFLPEASGTQGTATGTRIA